MICLQGGVGETVPFLTCARDGRREWRGRGARDRVQVEIHETGRNPRFGGGASSPPPLGFSADVLLAVGLAVDTPPTLLHPVDRLGRRQAVDIRSVAGGGGGGRRGRGGAGLGAFGRIGRAGGRVRGRGGGFGPLFPAAACVTIEVGRYAEAPAADLTCPGL